MDLETTNRRERLRNGKPEWMPESPDLSGNEQFIIANPQAVNRTISVLQQVDRQIQPVQKDSWRWRILYLRGLIDYELVHNEFRSTERCESAFEELIRIYHAKDAIWAVRPPASRYRNIGWI